MGKRKSNEGKRGNGEGSIFQRADGRWAGSITLEGRKKLVFYGKTRAEVNDKLTDAQKQKKDGVPIPRGRLNIATFLRHWLEVAAKPSVRPRTFQSYQMILETHLIPALGHISLVKLTPDKVQSYMNGKREAGLSARTVQLHHAVLRRALTVAERWGKVSRNVAKLVSPPPVKRQEVRPLTPTEARTFLNTIQGHRLEPLFAITLGLGIRQGEALGVAWDGLDLEGGTMIVRQSLQRYDGAYHLVEPKSEKSRRTIALPAPLVPLLRAHRTRQLEAQLRAGPAWANKWNLVFTAESGAPLDGREITKRFQAILAKAELPRQRYHDLRHAAATYLLAQGVPLRVVQELLGHATISLTANTYVHIMPELKRDAADRMGSLLWARS